MEIVSASEIFTAAVRGINENSTGEAISVCNLTRKDLEVQVGDFVLLDSKIVKLKVEGAPKLGHKFIQPDKIL